MLMIVCVLSDLTLTTPPWWREKVMVYYYCDIPMLISYNTFSHLAISGVETDALQNYHNEFYTVKLNILK